MNIAMMLASGVDWTNVLLALIAAVPGIIAAVYAGRVHHQVKTPSGTSIGKQIENTLHTSLANNYRLRKVGARVGAEESDEAQTEAQQVTQLPESDGEPL